MNWLGVKRGAVTDHSSGFTFLIVRKARVWKNKLQQSGTTTDRENRKGSQNCRCIGCHPVLSSEDKAVLRGDFTSKAELAFVRASWQRNGRNHQCGPWKLAKAA